MLFVYHLCVWCLWGIEEGIGSPKTGVTNTYKLLRTDLGSSEEQPVPLTTEPSRPSYFLIRSLNLDEAQNFQGGD